MMGRSKHLCARAAIIFVSALFAVAQTKLDHQPSREEVAQGRDLKLYDDGGDFYEMRLDAAKLNSLRTFIWDHWTQKKRGYARLGWGGMDTSGVYHIFIEPSEHGTMHILWRNISCWIGGDVVRWTLYDWEDIVALDRAKPGEQDYPGYILVFRAKGGKEVKRL